MNRIIGPPSLTGADVASLGPEVRVTPGGPTCILPLTIETPRERNPWAERDELRLREGVGAGISVVAHAVSNSLRERGPTLFCLDG